MSAEVLDDTAEKSPKLQKKKSKKRERDSGEEQKSNENPVKKQKKSKKGHESKEIVAEDEPLRNEDNVSIDKHKKEKHKKKHKLASDDINAQADELQHEAASPKSKPAPDRRTSIFSDKDVRKRSPFVQETVSFFLALSPVAHDFPLEGACAEHISPLLLTYYQPLDGVVLSYSNPRLSEHPEGGVHAGSSHEAKRVLGRSIDEYAVTYIWLTADFLIFRPVAGTILEGHVSLQNASVLGVICYNYFNAGIEQHRLPEDWKWVESEPSDDTEATGGHRHRDGEGHYVDGQGKTVEGKIVFEVVDFDATPGAESMTGSINIYGTLLSGGKDARAKHKASGKRT